MDVALTPPGALFAGRPATLPAPGGGDTAARFAALWEAAACSPSEGRLFEAHHDARAILTEAGRTPDSGATYGVWAAGGPEPATLENGRLRGTKHWCSGAGLLTHALVTVRHGSSNTLVLVTLDQPGVHREPATWRSPAFADTDTRTVRFDVAVTPDDVVGVDDWYLRRPGFWHGAIGVAACWAGCAAGVVARVVERWPEHPHALAHLGAIDSGLWALRAALEAAAREIDADPVGDDDTRRRRALRVRHIVDTGVRDVTDRLARAIGPGPLAHDVDLHVALAATDLYRRQCHAERDLEALGALSAARRA